MPAIKTKQYGRIKEGHARGVYILPDALEKAIRLEAAERRVSMSQVATELLTKAMRRRDGRRPEAAQTP